MARNNFRFINSVLLLLIALYLLYLSINRALAGCYGAFLKSDVIEDCLSPQEGVVSPPAGGRTRDWRNARNLTVTRPNSPASEAYPAVNLWINFAFDSAELTPDARITLDELAKALRGTKLMDSKFVLTGHTDAVGTAEYNQTLSERRANAVKGYLVSQGQIQTDRLVAEGVGYSKPMNADDARGAENRRVEVKIRP